MTNIDNIPLDMILIKVATTALSLSIGVLTIAKLAHFFEFWNPLVDCGSSFSLPPHHHPDVFLRTHLPFIDYQLCIRTQMFEEAKASGTPSPVLARVFLEGLLQTAVASLAIVAVEASRQMHWITGSFAMIGTLSQALVGAKGRVFTRILTDVNQQGISIVFPVLWLPSFAWTQATPTRTLSPQQLSKISLGSTAVLHRISLGFLLITLAAYALTAAPDGYFHVAVAFFQYLPSVIPAFWSSFAIPASASSVLTLSEAHASSRRAQQLFICFALILVAHQFRFIVLELLKQDSAVNSNLFTAANFALKYPREPAELTSWYMLWEWVSLATTMGLFALTETARLGENVALVLAAYTAASITIGSGATALLFAAWREGCVFARIRDAVEETAKLN
ncbi:hypothetical protein HDU83_008381 [Entophlyctis luteolus]|nr:hypothetical protein HDU82_002827 [Entophlyctis luteolus]KAJ3338037.1 hypothetical protein HDU83_008381 [Entophlyctis luteolus]KAJ3377191.1 hypothetical protein HDU84_008897 [Entophlyctis sp. JEL0112]